MMITAMARSFLAIGLLALIGCAGESTSNTTSAKSSATPSLESSVPPVKKIIARDMIDSGDFLGGNLMLKDPLDEDEFYCLDIFSFGSHANIEEALSAHTCKPEGWRDATFKVDYPEPGQIYMPAYDKCAEVTQISRGAHLMIKDCSDSILQRFIYREDQSLEVLSRKGPAPFCVVAHPALSLIHI